MYKFWNKYYVIYHNIINMGIIYKNKLKNYLNAFYTSY